MKKNKFKSRLLIALFALLFIAIIAYFTLRNTHSSMPNVTSEFIGVLVFAIIITYGFNKKNNLWHFIIALAAISIISTGLMVLGYAKGIIFLQDLMPEFMGGTILGLCLSLFFHRKLLF